MNSTEIIGHNLSCIWPDQLYISCEFLPYVMEV